MKRSIVIIAIVIAAIGIIPLVAQTTRNVAAGPKAQVCQQGQGECQGMGEACVAKCQDCPKAASGECQGCQAQCEAGEICANCPEAGCDMQSDAACESARGGCGMMSQGMGGGCGMGQCSQN